MSVSSSLPQQLNRRLLIDGTIAFLKQKFQEARGQFSCIDNDKLDEKF